jgi:hypothetical protein
LANPDASKCDKCPQDQAQDDDFDDDPGHFRASLTFWRSLVVLWSQPNGHGILDLDYASASGDRLVTPSPGKHRTDRDFVQGLIHGLKPHRRG